MEIRRGRFRIFRLHLLVSLGVLVPLGFASKLYGGPGAVWFNDYAGGILYEVFWCLVLIFVWPSASALGIALWVLGVTCFLEFLQLWHPPFLELVRSTFVGCTLIGTSFTWWDFPYYIIGCGIGWSWIVLLRSWARRRERS